MKFFLDAQLPFLLKSKFLEAGFDTLHTQDLPKGNQSSDGAILLFCRKENRIIVTKDSDFLQSKILKGTPKKLLLVSTGNCTNIALYSIFEKTLPLLEQAFLHYDCIEITQKHLIYHF